MTAKELSLYLGIACSTVYYRAERGRMPGHKVGGVWEFNKVEIDSWDKKKGPFTPSKDIEEAPASNPLTEKPTSPRLS